MLRTGLWLLCCAALLSACAEAPPRLEILRPEIPSRLLDCPDRPAPPGAEASQREAALYVIDLAEAHSLCRDRLHAVRDLLAPRGSQE